MNKAKLTEKIQEEVPELNKKQVEKVLRVLTDTIIKELKKGKKVNISGFGTFLSKVRHARKCVDPQKPQKTIKVPEIKVAKFKTGKKLKEELKK